MSSKKSSISSGNDANVVRAGFLKKMKTSRKKYFVLRAETPESSARLEYYDSQRKCLNGEPPKRSIPLKNCFNINRRLDTKHKHVIALYTKDDCFCVVLDTEDDVDSWLKALLSLQHGEEAVDGQPPKPIFAHIWQVTVLNRGLGTPSLVGSYRLCLTDKTLSLIKRDSEVPHVELNLTNIRSCGNLKDFFFLEIGRSSTLGAGELWMQTEDSNIAQNVHFTVFNAMTAHKEDMAPKSRNRSSSATESSKPNPTGRKQIHSGAPPKFAWSQDVSQATDTQVPSSSSSSQHPVVSGVTSFYHHLFHRGTSKASERRHSISAGGVTWSGNISHQRTQSLPLANPAPISDQNTTSQPSRAAKRSNQSSKCLSGGRERCDSMPSRARTTSEGNHAIQGFNNLPRSHLIPGYRPVSLYGRDISHSPPSGSPVSPPSVGCSTDSAGSSYSLADETDICTELDPTLNRYSHSLTPDEAIAEEDCPDSPSMLYGASPNNYVPMALHSSDDGYVDMSPRGRGGHNNSPTASLSSVTSGTPSTDMRFAEYPLEKVTSYFAPSEDDDARPTRCYSVGSRPEPHRHKKFIELLGSDARVRAFSVGSKTKKIPSKVLAQYSYYAPQGVKSSSAPILSNSRVQGSHSSVGPMDDLMEMDFSRSGSINNSGYMDMRPLFRSTNHGYVEMKPVIPENCRVPDTSAYVDMTSGSSPAKPSFITSQSEQSFNHLGDYMDMDQRKNSNNNNNNGDYLDMSKTTDKNSGGFQLSPAKVSYMQGSPSCNTIDGYVEMQPGRGHQRQSSLDSAQVAHEDYTNMSFGKKQRKPSKKEKARSQPIAIQNTTKPSTGSNMYAMLGRKFSTGTPPKMHLPLASCITSPYSSLPRQRSRKNSRRDSKDSSSSSVTTPSSSSTIFPFSLNSPCSPVKPETPVTIKVPPSVLNTTYKKSSDTTGYIMMDFDKTKSSDYVNYNPASRGDESNYAVMDLKPLNRVNKVDVDTAASRVSNLELDPPTNACFRPIKENKEETGEKPESVDQPSDSGYEVLRTNSIDKSRPTSAALSRPNSASSELCSSSGSTIVGSRPESVNSDRVRPASVSSADVQLHYASLDLDDGNRSPRTVKNATPNASVEGSEPTLTYAAIDFVKSEGLKQNPMASAKVVNKH